MARVDRFRRAEEDLLAIAEYIARDNPSAAAHWLDQIEEKLEAVSKPGASALRLMQSAGTR